MKKPFWPAWVIILGMACLAINSHPMMRPGFDIWIHLYRIESSPDGYYWYAFWKKIFDFFQPNDIWSKALLIHRFQYLATIFLIWVSAYFILAAFFQSSRISTTALVTNAGLAACLWLFMHGTVSAPIFGGHAFWQSWISWYSVNYQITLPVYFASAGALVFAAFGTQNLAIQVALAFLAFLGSMFIYAVHAGELPYLLYALLLIALLSFKPSLKWWYLTGIFALASGAIVFIKFSGLSPRGVLIFQESGWSGTLQAIENYGNLLIDGGLNRGNASWNYFYHAAAFSLLVIFLINPPRRQSNGTKAWCFIVLSAVPAAMLHGNIGSGLLALVTYPELAWRFTFSSFLFVAIPALLVQLGDKFPRLASPALQLMLGIVVVGCIAAASYATEKDRVSYQYTKSVFSAIDPERVHFGIPAYGAQWIKTAAEKAATIPGNVEICTDATSAYYLFFLYGLKNVSLPSNVQDNVVTCDFPADGGTLKQFNLPPVPWKE